MIPLGVLAGSARVGVLAVSDSFNRADNASSLGTADSGHVWTAHTGTWGIDGNRARCYTLTDDRHATVNLGASDQRIVADLSPSDGTFTGVLGRWTDAANCYWLSTTPYGDFFLARSIGDDIQVLDATEAYPVTVTLEITEEAGGTRLLAKADGVTKINYLDTTIGRPLTGTRVGLWLGFVGGADVAYFDNFAAEAL